MSDGESSVEIELDYEGDLRKLRAMCKVIVRSTATETNSAIDRSVRALRDLTNIV